MIKEYIINGIAGSGKDTLVKMIEKENKVNVYNFSSIDPFREVPREFGWNGDKDDTYRKCLSLLKQASILYDYPSKYLLEKRSFVYLTNEDAIIFYHIREPEEIKKFKLLIPSIKTVLVYRRGIDIPENDADLSVASYLEYDMLIDNTGSLEDLYNKIFFFL
jgi:hypothetical protein